MKIIKRDQIESADRGGYSTKLLFTKLFKKSPKDAGFYETTINKGGICKEQWHAKSYEVIYFLTTGHGKIVGKDYTFDKGDLLILDPGEKHEFTAPDNDVTVLALRFPHLPDDKFTTN